MSRSESIADWSPSAVSFVAPVLDGDLSACPPRECLNQFTRSTCPTNGDHLTQTRRRTQRVLPAVQPPKDPLGFVELILPEAGDSGADTGLTLQAPDL